MWAPPKFGIRGGGKINNKKVTLFGDSQSLTSSGKPCVRPLKKLPYKVCIFLVFYEPKKYFKGTLFSLKMRHLNKQGQQASSKYWKHPHEVITRWRSYTIWRYSNKTFPQSPIGMFFLPVQFLLQRQKSLVSLILLPLQRQQKIVSVTYIATVTEA